MCCNSLHHTKVLGRYFFPTVLPLSCVPHPSLVLLSSSFRRLAFCNAPLYLDQDCFCLYQGAKKATAVMAHSRWSQNLLRVCPSTSPHSVLYSLLYNMLHPKGI